MPPNILVQRLQEHSQIWSCVGILASIGVVVVVVVGWGSALVL